MYIQLAWDHKFELTNYARYIIRTADNGYVQDKYTAGGARLESIYTLTYSM